MANGRFVFEKFTLEAPDLLKNMVLTALSKMSSQDQFNYRMLA